LDLLRLLDQLTNFQKELKTFETEFRPLFEACVGVNVDFSKIGRIMIPKYKKNGEMLDEIQLKCDESQVSIIEYDWDHKQPIKNLQFKPRVMYPPTAI
jgi:hypothetical protein